MPDHTYQSHYYQTHTHISASHKWLDLKLKEVWRYRDLILLFTKRSFTVSNKQTVLGPLWLFIGGSSWWPLISWSTSDSCH